MIPRTVQIEIFTWKDCGWRHKNQGGFWGKIIETKPAPGRNCDALGYGARKEQKNERVNSDVFFFEDLRIGGSNLICTGFDFC